MSDELAELKEVEEEERNVLDDAAKDDSATQQAYFISSYGADWDVDGFVKRLARNDILIPRFQREYVWTLRDASRFVESLLLGLPVPGVFLARETPTNKLLVIDGQQRLKTLQFFYEGYFNPKPHQKTKRVFRLINVQKNFENRGYSELEEKDKIRLNDSIIHATIIKQESPEADDTSVYHVFERLNTGGRKLTPQEIRTAIYHGPIIALLKKLNEVPAWRKIFGRESSRLKDHELILRFLALYYSDTSYFKPMGEFLTVFAKRRRSAEPKFSAESLDIFSRTISAVFAAQGPQAFRPERALNAAVFDAVMVGVARRLSKDNQINSERLKEEYMKLLAADEFKAVTSSATSDKESVNRRIELATQWFANT